MMVVRMDKPPGPRSTAAGSGLWREVRSGNGRAVVAGLAFGIVGGLIGAATTLILSGSVLLALLMYCLSGMVAFLGVAGFIGWYAPREFPVFAQKAAQSGALAGISLFRGVDANTGKPPLQVAHRSNATTLAYKGRVVCAGGCTQGALQDISDFLVDQDFCVDICDDLEVTLGLVGAEPHRCSALVVELDHFESTSDMPAMIDALNSFRRQTPDVPVVLVSAAFARDDMGVHRLEIADASLRAPVTEQRLAEGMIAAWTNNRTWRHRLHARCMQDRRRMAQRERAGSA